METGRAPLQFFVDQPADWQVLERGLIIRGWCFAASGPAVQALRLRTPAGVFSAVHGLPRPDVKAALPAAPDENTGFEIRGLLPGGGITVHLEAQRADGSWERLITRSAKVRRPLRPRWLGGGTSGELLAFQMPAHMAYAAKPLSPEKFPAAPGLPRPGFSIVTPSYNQARFLPETMRSVLEQPGIDCAYVVQDGGSTDGTRQLLVPLAEANATQPGSPAPRLFAWESTPDGGQADAIARGFAKTAGAPDSVMAWINSDDFYLPGALGYVADYFARHPGVDVLYGHRIVVDEESREIARWFLPPHDPEVLRLNDFVPQETLFWRRRIWDQVGGIDPSFKFAMDWDLLLRFQAAGAKIVRVPYFLACFRSHPAQKTSAQMHSIGQDEIGRLRQRTFNRSLPASELESHPLLLRYLRRSAFIEFLWKLGWRAS